MSGAGTILVVEDNSTDVLLLRRAFGKAGVTNPLRVASDGEQAIAYLTGEGSYADREQHPWPSLMLLDLTLPRTSGFEVLAWMRYDPALRRVPVVMLTSSAQPTDIARAYDAGANAYHVKPSDSEGFFALAEALKTYWLRWTEPLAEHRTRRACRTTEDDDPIFPPITDLTNPVFSARSKVHALLSRHPAGLTPKGLADVFLSRGLAVGEVEVVARRIEEILAQLESGPSHRKVARTDDGRYLAMPFW
jgi:CheY-like chemotaxis protein